ncbi:glycosyltransferase [Nocardioides sp. CFH 31398]|uniref:glycosyltransferase n=1 Tax=Nocardioides sp. CFH 31398 TaxID=2919579 RepID=UPI001F0711A7|nr:glycosyltransferase [Nocardioides sp. CFH 31398]MCH1867263.1 glycosyltransferase [Nocardioides sp. CFH 31398]
MSLRVLMNAGPWLPVPPRGYGGIESVVATLVPELRARGVEVVLATVGTSTLPADEVLRPLAEGRLASVAAPYNRVAGIAHAHMGGVARWLREHEVDLVHDHLEVVGPAVLGAMGRTAPPALQTLHWDLGRHRDFYTSFEGDGRVRFAAVSRDQLRRAPANLARQTAGVVPLAVPDPPTAPGPRGEHVLALARITADKGQDLAALACHAAGVPLVLAGPVAGFDGPAELEHGLAVDPGLAGHPDVRFWLDHVAPLVDGELVRWVGGVSGEQKERLLATARALLTPVRWPEPGATSVGEALVRGVPVVGTRCGVLPDLVAHGTTGWLADPPGPPGQDPSTSVAELGDLLGALDDLSPAACRRAGEAWSPATMAQAYLDLYARVLADAA